MGTLRFFEEVVSFKIRRTFGFADYIRRCVGSIIFVPDRRRFGDLYVRVRTIELFAFF